MIDWALFGDFLHGWASVGVPLFCLVLFVRASATLLQGRYTDG